MRIEIIVAFIALAGALFGSLVGFQIARRNIKDQFFYAAAAKLKQSFLIVLRELRLSEHAFEINEETIIENMDESFGRHELAVTEFRYALPEWQRHSFDKAWINYKGEEKGSDKLKQKYSNIPNWQHVALKDIEAILAFTEPPRYPFWEALKYYRKKK